MFFFFIVIPDTTTVQVNTSICYGEHMIAIRPKNSVSKYREIHAFLFYIGFEYYSYYISPPRNNA